MMGKTVLWVVLAILILGGGLYLYKNRNNSPTSPAATQTTTAPSSAMKEAVSPTAMANATPSGAMKEQNAIILTNSGFEPSSITVKAGTKVVWTNKSGAAATVNSDPHPAHTAYPPLNLGKFNDGESVSLTFSKPGKYGYHNHFNPSETGVVIVE